MTNSQRQHGIGSLVEEKIVGKPGGLVEPGVKQYGFLKKIFKKVKKGAKKVWKSPLGKAALIGGGLWGLNAYGMPGMGGAGKGWWGKGLAAARNTGIGSALLGTGALPPSMGMAKSGMLGNIGKWAMANKGKAAMLGLGTAGVLAPFLAKDEDEEDEIQDWTIPSAAIAGLWDRTKDYYKNPGNLASSNLAFQPAKEFVNPRMYSAQGGIAQLANGGGAGDAQAEQMLKMEYQKYRNQGGTMSYQQFKMAVLQQAQGQGPMAQGQAQMSLGGRPGYQGGELIEDASMIEETPEGMMAENVEEIQGEPTREQMEALAMEIFQLRLEELDEEQLMIVYQAAMEQQPEEVAMQEEDIQFDPQMGAPQMAADGGRMGYLFGKKVGFASASPNVKRPSGNLKDNILNIFSNKLKGNKFASPGTPVATSKSFMGSMIPSTFQDADYQAYITSDSPLDYQSWKASRQTVADGGRMGLANGGVLGSDVAGYSTPPGYNRFDYPSGGVRVGRAEGGIMDLGGMEKDYRQEGGFVALGGEERADDVPARLSKNEFVFTADAVRSAGGGDIDAGAEVMENVMNNLEQGGQISEDSQGLGGEEMISEEELIEGPNGAQEMYDQQAMLQSRMA